MNKKQNYKDELLKKQNGLCALCGRGDFCSACYHGSKHDGPCRIQKVNTLDHDHSCCKTGCEKCYRGITHNYCNRVIPILEINPHLQSPFIKDYLKGKILLKEEIK
jgi:hypothetical protein